MAARDRAGLLHARSTEVIPDPATWNKRRGDSPDTPPPPFPSRSACGLAWIIPNPLSPPPPSRSPQLHRHHPSVPGPTAGTALPRDDASAPRPSIIFIHGDGLPNVTRCHSLTARPPRRELRGPRLTASPLPHPPSPPTPVELPPRDMSFRGDDQRRYGHVPPRPVPPFPTQQQQQQQQPPPPAATGSSSNPPPPQRPRPGVLSPEAPELPERRRLELPPTTPRVPVAAPSRGEDELFLTSPTDGPSRPRREADPRPRPAPPWPDTSIRTSPSRPTGSTPHSTYNPQVFPRSQSTSLPYHLPATPLQPAVARRLLPAAADQLHPRRPTTPAAYAQHTSPAIPQRMSTYAGYSNYTHAYSAPRRPPGLAGLRPVREYHLPALSGSDSARPPVAAAAPSALPPVGTFGRLGTVRASRTIILLGRGTLCLVVFVLQRREPHAEFVLRSRRLAGTVSDLLARSP